MQHWSEMGVRMTLPVKLFSIISFHRMYKKYYSFSLTSSRLSDMAKKCSRYVIIYEPTKISGKLNA